MRLLLVTLSALLFLVSCGTEDSSQEAIYRKITPEEAKTMMTEDSRILDVRTEAEYKSGYIPGAELLPVDRIQAGDLDTLRDKDQVLLVYCRSGNRSRTASEALVEAGYTQVYDFGGIIDWPYDLAE